MRILYFVPSLGFTGVSRQVELLAHGLAASQFQLQVCQLGPASETSERLQKTGVIVHSLGWTRMIDPAAFWNLHRVLRNFDPDVVHVWKRPCLRLLALLSPRLLSRTVLSQPFNWDAGSKWSWLDRRLLRRVARVVVHGEAESAYGQRQGLFLDKLAVIPPGIAASAPVASPPRLRQIACIGPLVEHKGYRDAVWTFDMLAHVFPTMSLTFVGDGPERPYLERFAEFTDRTDAIDFAGHTEHVTPHLARAEICWIPSRRGGGTHATLEAMLAGRPIIASRVPNLEDLVVDGVTGLLVPPGNKFALAQRTRQLFLDPELAARLAKNARDRALSLFASHHVVQRHTRLYQEVAA